MANCPHTIGVEFGTRIIEVAGQKIKLQVWDTGMNTMNVVMIMVIVSVTYFYNSILLFDSWAGEIQGSDEIVLQRSSWCFNGL